MFVSRKKSIKIISILISIILIIPIFSYSAMAHSLLTWYNRYKISKANSTYAFSIDNAVHIDGNSVNYYWYNETSKQLLNTEVVTSFPNIWNNIISGHETTPENAHIQLSYNSVDQPDNVLARTKWHVTILFHTHIRTGKKDAEIIFYEMHVQDKSQQDKYNTAGHEFGHLFGLADTYKKNKTLNSIYSNTGLYAATRHDKNGLRIGLNNLWYEPVQGAWWYQPKPDEWHLRGDVVGNDDTITAADARQILRFSAKLDAATNLQLILSDVDGDGTVTAADARFVQQYAAKTITNFPADHD